MGIDERMRIDGIHGPNESQPPGSPAGTDQTEFRRILERLEEVARQSKPAEVENFDKLREVMKKADDEFSAVMDLRRQLEDAYRKSQQ